MKKNITESQEKRNFDICNLHSCYNFALVLHENALDFSQSETRDFLCTSLVPEFP